MAEMSLPPPPPPCFPSPLSLPMTALDDITLGRYVAGSSLLHRLDPRVKAVVVPLLVIATFSGPGPGRLEGLAVLAIGLALLSGIGFRTWWRGLWVFRWLFLFTILLHLCFTPGRTLFGLTWLSLDGLLHGMTVCSQLALAVCFSSLLTLTSTPHELAAAFASLFSPLERFGFPVREGTMLLLLVLHFIPILREEAGRSFARCREEGLDPGRGSLLERGKTLGSMIAPLILSLVERADRIAQAAAAGEDVVGKPPELKPFRSFGLTDLTGVLGGGLCLGIVLGLLR
jgi:energy-coupling factor transport system permease protein